MLTNYLKIAVRNLLRHRLYSLLNVLGLAIGMVVCALILLWVQDELSYDRFHEHADRIYRTTVGITSPEGPMEAPVAAAAVGPVLRRDVPGVAATTDIHLRSHLVGEVGRNGDIAYVYAFSAIAVFVLLIACINFTNLATARSSERAREVGVRKVAGAHRRQLIGQFLGESLLICALALVITLALLEVLLPSFNELAGKELRLEYAGNGWIPAALAGMALLAGLAAGSYPAFFLSTFQPASVLKGTGQPAVRKGRFRGILVVVQFAISTGLIAGTLIISAQVDLWDDLAATPESIPVHDWQKEELARRKANLINHPASGLTWEEVRRRVQSRHGR